MLTADETTLSIRGMVCARCTDVVRRELTTLGFAVTDIRLGQVRVSGPIPPVQMGQIERVLEKQGFSLLTDAKVAVVQRVKALIEQMLTRDDLGERRKKFSDLLAIALQTNYGALSALFSASEGQTIERYIIERRLDKVKELLVYTDLSLGDIAFQTGFSSVPHLSNQFKRITGLSPTHFRNIRRVKQALQQRTA